jgi:hypothetical protein
LQLRELAVELLQGGVRKAGANMANIAPSLALPESENKRSKMRSGSARSGEAGDHDFLPSGRLDLEPVGCPRSRKVRA